MRSTKSPNLELLWTFHLFVVTLQQHMYMEYISLSWSDIPEFVVPMRIPIWRVSTSKEATEPTVPIGYGEVITSTVLRSQSCHGYVPLVVSTPLSFPHSWCHCIYNKSKHDGCHTKSRNCLPFRDTWDHPRFLVVFLLLDIKLSVYCFVDHACHFFFLVIG